MKVLAVVNNKGGVGKTTSAQNIGAGLAKFASAKVLLIDLDPQANLTRSFGIVHENLKNISSSFILGESSFADSVQNVGSIDILPSSTILTTKEDAIKAAPTFPFNLKLALEKQKPKYDYVIIDCPPAMSALTRIALAACSHYYVPLQAEFLSYEGLRNFLTFTNDLKQICPDIKLGGVFATRYNPKIKKKISVDIITNAQEQLGGDFMKTYIRDNVSVSEAQAMGKDIFDYAPQSKGAIDYYNLVKEILQKT